ncbi:MAG: GTP-binding protein [Mariprofundaceae bacterium]
MMQIKVFTAPRLHEALALVRQGLGADAIVLDRMEGTDAEGKRVWHVHAALDREEVNCQNNDRKPSVRGKKSKVQDTLQVQKLEASMLRLEKIVEGLGRKEVENLRLAITDNSVQQAFDYLLELGLSPNYAYDIAEDYAAHLPVGEAMLNWAKRINPKEKQTVMLLAGPSGAGKTLLAAKLATHYSMRGVRVGLLTTDADRMGGGDVLKSYADILGAPFMTVRNVDDAELAMQKMQSAQLLLIDSEGWNIHRTVALKKQCAIWHALPCTHRVLVMPANMDESDGMDLLVGAEAVQMTEIAFTKLDETSRPGKIVNWAMASKLALSYGGFGPDVPDQMGWLTPQALTALLERQSKHAKEVA